MAHRSGNTLIVILSVLFTLALSAGHFYWRLEQGSATYNVLSKGCIPNNKVASDDLTADDPRVRSGDPIITLCFDNPPEIGKEVGVTLNVLPRSDSLENGGTLYFFLSDGFSLSGGNLNTRGTFKRGALVKNHITVTAISNGALVIRGCAEQKYSDNSGESFHCDLVGGTLILGYVRKLTRVRDFSTQIACLEMSICQLIGVT